MFHANCLHWRQVTLNVKSCFLEKKKKKYFNKSAAENFTLSAKRYIHCLTTDEASERESTNDAKTTQRVEGP